MAGITIKTNEQLCMELKTVLDAFKNFISGPQWNEIFDKISNEIKAAQHQKKEFYDKLYIHPPQPEPVFARPVMVKSRSNRSKTKQKLVKSSNQFSKTPVEKIRLQEEEFNAKKAQIFIGALTRVKELIESKTDFFESTNQKIVCDTIKKNWYDYETLLDKLKLRLNETNKEMFWVYIPYNHMKADNDGSIGTLTVPCSLPYTNILRNIQKYKFDFLECGNKDMCVINFFVLKDKKRLLVHYRQYCIGDYHSDGHSDYFEIFDQKYERIKRGIIKHAKTLTYINTEAEGQEEMLVYINSYENKIYAVNLHFKVEAVVDNIYTATKFNFSPNSPVIFDRYQLTMPPHECPCCMFNSLVCFGYDLLVIAHQRVARVFIVNSGLFTYHSERALDAKINAITVYKDCLAFTHEKHIHIYKLTSDQPWPLELSIENQSTFLGIIPSRTHETDYLVQYDSLKSGLISVYNEELKIVANTDSKIVAKFANESCNGHIECFNNNLLISMESFHGLFII